MAKPITDGSIGKRMCRELKRLFPFDSTDVACEKLGISKFAYYSWSHKGVCPSAYYVAELIKLGGDARYVLTGRRTA